MKKYWYRRILIMALVFFCIGRWKLSFDRAEKRCHEARGERSDL